MDEPVANVPGATGKVSASDPRPAQEVRSSGANRAERFRPGFSGIDQDNL